MTGLNFAAAVAQYHRADQAVSDFCDTVQARAEANFKAAVAGVPHRETTNSYLNFEGDRVHWSTAKLHQPDTARSILAKETGERADTQDGVEYLATLREIVELADARNAQIAALREAHRIDEIRVECDALSDISGAALDLAIAHPVASMLELVEKVDFINAQDVWGEASGALSADIRRLAAEVGHG